MKFIKEKYMPMQAQEKQKVIKLIKDEFEKRLASALELSRVSAPMVVTRESGLQDDLIGVERPVSFDIKKDGAVLEIVQSLAKWKRFALLKYGFKPHTGLYTDMHAIRRDDKVDATHSIFVDQWDWEKAILRTDRTLKYLKETVQKIVDAIFETAKTLKQQGIDVPEIEKQVYFISSEELLKMYPTLSAKQREYEITKRFKTVFITQIGDILSSGEPHDLRAPDYDDWQLDGDLLVYHEVLDCALELSSMGIRVDKKAILMQLKKAEAEDRLEYAYHKGIIDETFSLSIGGGIGQSRLCQYLLKRAHIGEVQASYWDEETHKMCAEFDIDLL